MNDLHEVQKEMIRFLRNLPEVSPLEIKTEFKKLHHKLKGYEGHPYERRAFLYLDIISWLESKIENRPVAEIIAKKVAAASRWLFLKYYSKARDSISTFLFFCFLFW